MRIRPGNSRDVRDSPLLGECRGASVSAATPHDELVASTPRAIASCLGERSLGEHIPGFHWIVSKPAIRVNGTTKLDSLLHKGEQTLCRRVGYAAHPNASNTRAILFRSNDNQGLGFRLSPASALFRTSNIGLVHLDCAREPIASRTHHRPPQFVQPRPSCLVTSQS